MHRDGIIDAVLGTPALEYAHERGIVQGDLKPANVKVSRDDAMKILDFGLAKAVEGEIEGRFDD